MYEYRCKLVNVVDGDTVDVDIDLGFDHWLHNQRIRLEGIDAPESRTSDLMEKVFGLAAKDRLLELLTVPGLILLSNQYERGKYGRILGDFKLPNKIMTVTDIMILEHHAVQYHGQSRQDLAQKHQENRKLLLEQGVVVLPSLT